MSEDRRIAMPDGETLSVPAGLAQAVPPHQAREDFIDRLMADLRRAGFYLVPAVRSASREAVNIDLYSLALVRKAQAERHQKLAADMLFPVVMRDTGDGLASLDVRDLLRPIVNDIRRLPEGADRETVLGVLERLDMAHEILCSHPPGTVVLADDANAVRRVVLGDGVIVTIGREG